MDLIAHLLDTSGFPTPATYARGWSGTLIFVFTSARALRIAAYLFFGVVFVQAFRAVKAGRIDEQAARVHMPRIMAFYVVSVISDLALNCVQAVSLWWPALNLVGLVSLLSSLCLLAASFKTWYAYTLCVRRRPNA